MFNKKLKGKLLLIETDLYKHINSHHHIDSVRVKRKNPISTVYTAGSRACVVGSYSAKNFEQVAAAEALQMIIDFLGLEYEDGKPIEQRLVKAKGKKKKS